MEKNPTLVVCPKCGNEFSAESAIENQVREKMQKEFQQKNKEQSDELLKQKEEIKLRERLEQIKREKILLSNEMKRQNEELN